MTDKRLDYYSHLLTVMAKTRAARFGAAGSLLIKERISVSVVAFLSIYLLGWSVISLSYPEVITSEHSRFFTVVSAVSAAAVLAITLMDQSFSRALRAEKFQSNALQISQLMRELERELVEPSPSFEKMSAIAVSYEEYISQTAINHSPMDYKKSQYERAKSKNAWVNSLYRLRSLAYTGWFYGCSMVVYFALVALVVFSTAWYTAVQIFGTTRPA